MNYSYASFYVKELAMNKSQQIIRLGKCALKERLKKYQALYDHKMLHPEKCHVRLQKGTDEKLGRDVYHTSRIPVLDCCKTSCIHCDKICYDIHHNSWRPAVLNDRVRNSVIIHTDRARYWSEVDIQIKALYLRGLRLNVGGDLDDEDFPYVAELGKKNPKCHILFFTKNYNGINTFLNSDDFTENIHPILSIMPGLEFENPHNLPCAHIRFKDGTSTAPRYGAITCFGNCTECLYDEKGCMTLKKGDHLIFDEH